MKFRLNSPKFLTFMCYIKGWEKSVYITNTTKKLLMTGSKNINLPSLVSWAMLHSMRNNKETKFCYRLYKPKFSNNLGILQFLHHKWKKTYSALQKRDYVANFHSKMREKNLRSSVKKVLLWNRSLDSLNFQVCR